MVETQSSPPGRVPTDEQLDTLVTVLDLVRSGSARTRPELAELSGLGRNVVVQRVNQLLEHGLLEEAGLGRSTGGRAPRELRLRADAGVVLAAHLGATGASAAVSDLAGRLVAQRSVAVDIARGPEDVLGDVHRLLRELLSDVEQAGGREVYGVGVGLPGPVEFASGRPVSPPIMPGWDAFPVRDWFAERYAAPVWVDNDVNLLALGELRAGLGQGEKNVIYVKVGTGIGAGLVSNGRLHRGEHGCAGDIGHTAVLDETTVVCRCGNIGCLEALAGGAAVARDATQAAQDGRSAVLARMLTDKDALTAEDVGLAAGAGDAVAVQLISAAGARVGESLATLVNFFDPSLIILGGGIPAAGDLMLATVRQTVYRRSLPLATRNLRIARSPLGRNAGPLGAAFMVIDELFSRQRIGLWLGSGSPAGRPSLAEAVP